jgi:hypothetical protein
MRDSPDWLAQLYYDIEKCSDEHSKRLLQYCISDYSSLWNALAQFPVSDFKGHGNYYFAKQSMLFLELVSRMATNSLLETYSRALKNRNDDYFLQFAFDDYSKQGKRIVTTGFLERDGDMKLPFEPTAPEQPILLWFMFDLVRNGMAHQAEQITLKVNSTESVVVGMSGVHHFGTLFVSENERKTRRLRFRDGGTNHALDVFPEVLFLDFAKALADSKIFLKPDFRVKLIERECKIENAMWDSIKLDMKSKLRVQ